MTFASRACVVLYFVASSTAWSQTNDDRFATFIADPQTDSIQFFWRDDKGLPLKSILNVERYVNAKHHQLLFAMNAGMYMADNSPLGLFIQNHHVYRELNTRSGDGNFYLKPNGVFYIADDGAAVVCSTDGFVTDKKINLATQSGPMLVIDGEMHSAFKQGSKNVNIRNGVGILPDGRILFAISKVEVNFYDFAEFFMNMQCKNALYLDGFVSRAYIPSAGWEQRDGNFGVIIGIFK